MPGPFVKKPKKTNSIPNLSVFLPLGDYFTE
ncbi:MAG: hypothetical protein K0S23_2405 [Fluviicola sp.]|jgi:hypothetical protein|nr:hypothetical protein [Fluviicola sp.]